MKLVLLEQQEYHMARLTSLTRKGQVTLPKEVRDKLGLKPFDKVEITVDGEGARLRKARVSLRDVAGSLPALGVDVEEMTGIAKEERAQHFGSKNS